MSMSLVLALAQQQVDHPWHGLTADQLRAQLHSGHFDGFVTQFIRGYRLLRNQDHFQAATESLCSELTRQGVVSADVLYSPGVYIQKLGVPLTAIHKGIAAGLRLFPNLRVRFVVDTVLNLGPAFMNRTLDSVLRDRPDFLAGFSVGGGVADLDMRLYLPLFHRAARAGLFLTAHAGEVDGPENILVLLQELDIAHIAHACRAVESPQVLALMRRRGVTVDVCPSSNLHTGVVKDLRKHPARVFAAEGIPITINTDDPFYFNTNLFREYQHFCQAMDWDDSQWSTLMWHSLKGTS